MVGLRRAAIVIAVALLAGQAHAQSDDALQRARSHFDAARALYNLGNYTDAVREFAAGYQLAPRPKFLLNLGQCYKKLGDLEKARDMYERYVRDTPLDDPERAPAQDELRDLESRIAAAHQPSAPPPSSSGPEGTRSGETPPPILTPAAETLTATAPPPHKPWIKRNWWVIPVGVVVVGAAVGLGVYFGTRSSSPCQAGDLLCVDGSKWAVQQ